MKKSVVIGIVIAIILGIIIYLLFFTNNTQVNEPLILKGTLTSTNSQKFPGEITAFEFKDEEGRELSLNIEKAKLIDKNGNEITYDKFKVGDVVQITTKSGDIFLSSNFLKPSEIKIIEEDNCAGEGEQVCHETPEIECCEGLSTPPNGDFDLINGECFPIMDCATCINCGDGSCGPGENICNCPEDCES